jgi:hypothetical protein
VGVKMLFHDIESGLYVSRSELFTEYETGRKNEPYNYDFAFDEYIENCLTKNNGTLEIVQEKRRA